MLVLLVSFQGGIVHLIKAEEEIVFTYGMPASINLNPLTGYSYIIYRSVLWCTLYAFNKTWGSEPWAAEYAKRIDPLTWEIKLRDDLYWHDGEPVTSDDYKFTWELLLKYPTSQTRFLKGVKSIEVVNDKVFRVHMEYPLGGIAPFLTGPCVPVPKHIWEPMGLTNESALTYENVPAIGMGPFKFVEYKPGEYLVVEAFDKFFAGRPKIDRLIIRNFASTEAMMAALKAGDIDACGLVPSRAAFELMKEPDIQTFASDIPNLRSIYINQYSPKEGHPSLNDLTVRKAIAMCIDKEALNELLHPSFTIGYTPIPPYWPEFNPEVKELAPKFNSTAAGELLEAAGYKDTDGDGIREDPYTGMPLVFRLWVYSGTSEELRAAEFIREEFRKAGMDAEIKLMEAVVWDIVVSPPYDWDLVLWGWAIHDPITCWYPYTSDAIPAKWSSSGYNNSEFDELYSSLLAAETYDEYLATQHALQEHFVKNVVEIILYHGVTKAAARTEWTGFVAEPDVMGPYGFNSKAFLYVHPVAAPQPTPPVVSPWLWIGITAAVVVAIVVPVIIWTLRRKRSR